METYGIIMYSEAVFFMVCATIAFYMHIIAERQGMVEFEAAYDESEAEDKRIRQVRLHSKHDR